MNFLECLRKAKHGQKIRRKCWNNGPWHGEIEEDYDGVRIIFKPWNIGTYFGNLLAEDWEIVEEQKQPEFNKSGLTLTQVLELNANQAQIIFDLKGTLKGKDKKIKELEQIITNLQATWKNFWENHLPTA